MHFIGIGIAVFAALWLFSWTERRRQKPHRPPQTITVHLDAPIGGK